MGGAGEEVGLKLLISQMSVGERRWFGELGQERTVAPATSKERIRFGEKLSHAY